MMKRYSRIFLAFGALVTSFGVYASDCGAPIRRSIAKEFKTSKIAECLKMDKVLPVAMGGPEQVVALLLDKTSGVNVVIYGTFKIGKKQILSPKPLFVFSGMGEAALELLDAEKGEVNKKRLLVRDLNADGFREIGVLGFNNPTSVFFLKSFSQKDLKFQDAEFVLKGAKDTLPNIVLDFAEKLVVPTSLRQDFEVKPSGFGESRKFEFLKFGN